MDLLVGGIVSVGVGEGAGAAVQAVRRRMIFGFM
jgi:hypothetical protein